MGKYSDICRCNFTSAENHRLILLTNIHVPFIESSLPLISSVFLPVNTIAQPLLVWITIQASILN